MADVFDQIAAPPAIEQAPVPAPPAPTADVFDHVAAPPVIEQPPAPSFGGDKVFQGTLSDLVRGGAAPPAPANPPPAAGDVFDQVSPSPDVFDESYSALPLSLRAPTTPQEYSSWMNDPAIRYTIKSRPGMWGANDTDTEQSPAEMYQHFVPPEAKQRIQILQNVATREAKDGNPDWQLHQSQVDKLKHDLVKHWVGKFDPTAFPEDAAAVRQEAEASAASGLNAAGGAAWEGYSHNAFQIAAIDDNRGNILRREQQEAYARAHPTIASMGHTAGSIVAPESLAAASAGGGVGALAGVATGSALTARVAAQAAQGAGQAFTLAATEDRLPSAAEVATNVLGSVAGGAAAHGVSHALPFAQGAARAAVAGDLVGAAAHGVGDWSSTAAANAAAMVATNKAAAVAQGNPYTTEDAARDFAMGLALEPVGRLAGHAGDPGARAAGPVAAFADEPTARKFVADNPNTTYAGRAPTGEHLVVPAPEGALTRERWQMTQDAVQNAQAAIRRQTGDEGVELQPALVELPAFAQNLGERLGLKLHFYTSNRELGEGMPEAVHLDGGNVAVDARSRDALAAVPHEFVHELRQTDPKAYAELAGLAQRTAPHRFAQARQEYADRFSRQFGRPLDPALLHEEGVADFLKTMMTPQKFAYLTRRDPTMADRLGALVRRTLGVAAHVEDPAAARGRSAGRFNDLVGRERDLPAQKAPQNSPEFIPEPTPAAAPMNPAEGKPEASEGRAKPREAAPSAEQGRSAEAPPPPAADSSPGETPRIETVAKESIHADPARFQYKLGTNEQGAGQSLTGAKKFNPELAGVISVWRDPADGRDYVVNGHHRLDKAMKDPDTRTLDIRRIQASSAEAARSTGALINIAEGNGTSIDAAKFMRDRKMTAEEMQGLGIDLTGAVARQGAALARLSPEVFAKVVSGEISPRRGETLSVLPHDGQRAILNAIGDRLVSDDAVRQMVSEYQSSPQVQKEVASLFGNDTVEQNLFLERAQLRASVRRLLATRANVMKFAENEKNADILKSSNVADVDTESAGKLSRSAQLALFHFDTFVNRKGPIADIINAAVKEISDGGKKSDIISRTVGKLVEAIRENDAGGGGTDGARGETLPGGRPGGAGEGQGSADAPPDDTHPLGDRVGDDVAPFSLFHRPVTGGESGDLFKDRPLPPRRDGRPAGEYDFLKRLEPGELRGDLEDLARRNAGGSKYINRDRNQEAMAAIRAELLARGEPVIPPDQMQRWGLTDQDVRLAEPQLADALTAPRVYGVKRALAGQGMKSVPGMTGFEAKEAHEAWKAAKAGMSQVAREAAQNPQGFKPQDMAERQRIEKNQTGESGRLFSLAGPNAIESTAPADAVTPFSLASKTKSLVQDLRDNLNLDPVPRLTRLGGGDEASAHAFARPAAKFLVRDLLAKVFPEQYRDPAAMARTWDVLNKNDLLGLYDDFKEKAAAKRAEAASLGKEPVTIKGTNDERIKQLARAGDEYQAKANAIDLKHNVAEMDAEVKAAGEDPVIAGNIARWREHGNSLLDGLFNEMKALDPDMPQDRRGRYFGTRVNLVSRDHDLFDFGAGELGGAGNGEPDPARPAGGTLRNAKVSKDRWDQSANGLGTYETDPQIVLDKVVGSRWNQVTKLRLFKTLAKRGLGTIADLPPAHIEDGQAIAWRKLDITQPKTEENGFTRMVPRTMWVRPEVYREVRDVLNTDLAPPSSPILRGLTRLQLLQLADAVTHTKNMHSVLAQSLGGETAWRDLVRKVPGLASGDAVKEWLQTWHEMSQDTPKVRADLAEMARRGLLRPDFPATGFQKITRMQDFLHHADTAGRLILFRRFNNLVERGVAQDTGANMRGFVNQLGNYNRRLMNPLARVLKDLSLSPFITAGKTFNRQGRRLILGDPGFKATSTAAAARARAMNFGGLAITLGLLPGLINSVTAGSPLGRSGTPVGAIDTGLDDDKGKHIVFDYLQLMGIRRGLRSLGVDAIANGLVQGKDWNTIGGNVVNDVTNSALHPVVGPGVGFLAAALTGRRFDTRGQMEAHKVPEGGLQQNLENARAALASQNPLLYSMGSAAASLADKLAGGEGSGQSTGKDLLDIGSTLAKSPLSAIGIKSVNPGRDAAEDAAARLAGARFGDSGPSDAASAHAAQVRKLAQDLRDGSEGAYDRIHAAVAAGEISEKDIPGIIHRSSMSELEWKVSHLSGADAAKVFAAGTDQEKEMMRDAVIGRVAKDNTLSSSDRAALLKDLGGSPEEARLVGELADLTAQERSDKSAHDRILSLTRQINQASASGDGAGAQKLRRQRQALARTAAAGGGRKVNHGRLKRLRAIRGRVAKLRKQAGSGSLPKAVAARRIRATFAAMG